MSLQLPTIADLYSGDIKQAQDLEKFTMLMNSQPDPSWVKIHPYIKNYKYLPIDRVEYLLKMIFKQFRIEITGQGTAFNGVFVTIRLHFLHPITGEWSYHDGVGAAQLQTAKGASAADFDKINNGAIAMAFPLAKTVAVKDAADHLGTLFGSDLNRRDTIGYFGETSILATIKKEVTPENIKLWENAKLAFKRDGNLNKVLEKCEMSAENAERLKLECQVEDVAP